MNPRDNTDRLLSAWLELEAPATVPDDLRIDIHRATARIRPRPAWLARLRGNPMEVITGGAGRRRDARLVPVLLLFLLLLALMAGAAYVGSSRDDDLVVAPSPGASAAAPSAVTSTTPAASPVSDATITFPFNVTEIVAGETATWVTVAGEDTNELPRAIYRIDRGATDAQLVVAEIGAPATSPVAIAEAGGSVWAVTSPNVLIQFSLPDGTRQGTVELGNFPIEPHVAFGAVWSLNYDDGSLGRIDPATSTVVTTIEIPQFEGQGPRDVAPGERLLWAITPRQSVMVGIDPATNTVADEIALGAGMHCGVAVMAGRIWVDGCDSSVPLEVFDEATGDPVGVMERDTVRGLPLFEADGAVWIQAGGGAPSVSTRIVAVNPVSLEPIDASTVDLGVTAGWMIADDGALWYSLGSNVYRLSLDSFATN
jgi:hypothetical protein